MHTQMFTTTLFAIVKIETTQIPPIPNPVNGQTNYVHQYNGILGSSEKE